MKCPVCGAPTRVTHTYICGSQKTIERRCTNKHRLTFVMAYVQEAKKRGQGAAALARRLREGKTRIHVEEETDQG